MRLVRREPGLEDRLLKVLVPLRLRRFSGRAAGHRAVHYIGDWSLGVGLLATQPAPTAVDLARSGMSRDEVRAFRWVEADYVSLGDWVIYAAPNEFENPYVIDVRAA
jgi:hypothetical protein